MIANETDGPSLSDGGDALSVRWAGGNNVGGAFGGTTPSAAWFESTDPADLNSTVPGSRFFHPVATAQPLLDRGTDVGAPYLGAAPDVGAVEHDG